jgi:pullulanase
MWRGRHHQGGPGRLDPQLQMHHPLGRHAARWSSSNYNGSPAGYVLDPGEVVNYVENHDNQTLFDINAYRLPTSTSREDRARVQILARRSTPSARACLLPCRHRHACAASRWTATATTRATGSTAWTGPTADNNFGVGLPPAGTTATTGRWARCWPTPLIKPGAAEIAWTRDAFRDLLRIRQSSTLLRLRTAEDIKARLSFHNTGSGQEPTVLVGHLHGVGYPGANFDELVYLINVDKTDKQLTLPALAGRPLELHPVHTAAGAADRRAALAGFDRATGRFSLPARTAVVFVARSTASQ